MPDCINFRRGPFHSFIRGGIRGLLGLELSGENRQSGLACRPRRQSGGGISEAEIAHLNSLLRCCPLKEPFSAQKALVAGRGESPWGKRLLTPHAK